MVGNGFKKDKATMTRRLYDVDDHDESMDGNTTKKWRKKEWKKQHTHHTQKKQR